MKIIRSFLPDIMAVIGAGLVSFGAWLVYEPAGFVVAGALFFVGGLIVARGEG